MRFRRNIMQDSSSPLAEFSTGKKPQVRCPHCGAYARHEISDMRFHPRDKDHSSRWLVITLECAYCTRAIVERYLFAGAIEGAS